MRQRPLFSQGSEITTPTLQMYLGNGSDSKESVCNVGDLG